MFDGKNFGYIAIGDVITFRSLAGEEIDILRVPQDVDSHALARALNDALNAVVGIVVSMSQYKL